jgi:hypothetical protein
MVLQNEADNLSDGQEFIREKDRRGRLNTITGMKWLFGNSKE